MSIKIDEVASAHYRNYSVECMYCAERATELRVTVMRGGAVLVASLCKEHAEGEMASVTAGMRNDPGTSDFYSQEEGT